MFRGADYLSSDEMWLYYAFLEFVLPILNDFNTTFQAGEAMIGHLHTEMIRLLRKLMGLFVTPRVIKSQSDISAVDYKTRDNQHDDEVLAIGWTAREFLRENPDLSPTVISKFYKQVRIFYSAVVEKMIQKIPFNDEVLMAMGYLNPDTRENVASEAVLKLADRFMPLEAEDRYKLEDELQDYILTPKSELSTFNETTSLEHFWTCMKKMKIAGSKEQFPQSYM